MEHFKDSYDLHNFKFQLMLSSKGHDSTSPATGYGIDLDSVIVFSTAPAASDIFWGNFLLANNLPTFDISDNKIDNFTGDEPKQQNLIYQKQ